ncbi:MAG: hypothetical protein H7Y37_09860 [Anaerolineae bacterium]|nr:hypothetical protein [Gloeobacterales cyanobacterium ES-bin-313]
MMKDPKSFDPAVRLALLRQDLEDLCSSAERHRKRLGALQCLIDRLPREPEPPERKVIPWQPKYTAEARFIRRRPTAKLPRPLDGEDRFQMIAKN